MKYALIGCGRISPNHIAAAKANGLEIAAICDLDPQNMQDKILKFELGPVHTYTDYRELLERYRQTLSAFVGPTEIFACGDTLQLKDYSKTDWPWYFDGEAKQRRHETVFPEERKQVYQLGANLAG